MANNIKDWTFNKGKYGDLDTYSDANATVIAIRNLLLAKPGNFPGTPSLGMNIEKYQFDILDSQTINKIKNELYSQIYQYIPSIDNVNISIDKIDREENTYLGISISAMSSGDNLTANFLIVREEHELNVYNEIF